MGLKKWTKVNAKSLFIFTAGTGCSKALDTFKGSTTKVGKTIVRGLSGYCCRYLWDDHWRTR